VAVMGALGALSMALGGLNFGLFIKPMGDDLGVGRAVFGWSQSARSIASAATAPLIGGLIDRFGARVLLAVAAAMTGVALIGLGSVTAGWQIIALYALMGVVGMSGPGSLVTTVPVTKWFVRRRGLALSMMSLGVPVGGLLFVPLTQILIDAVGWRQAWVILALLGAGLILPLALVFVRREPEDMGLLPDGGPVATPTGLGLTVVLPDERSWTRAEAMRSGAFWRLVVAFSIVQMAISSVGVHRIASFMDRGLDPRLISYATALDAAASGVSTFAMGFVIQRIPARFVGAGGFLMLAFASALTIAAADHPTMFVSMISFGTGIGVLGLMNNYLWADYFGRQHLGAIRGAVTPIMLGCSSIGAPVAGYVRDATGDYGLVWTVSTVLMVLGALTIGLTPPPAAEPTPVPLSSAP
jgi:MFS transporter, OFA family, oxalate/formate antiporter